MKTYLIELTGYDIDGTSIETLYFSSAAIPAFSSSDSDRPNIYYSPRVLSIGGISRRMFSTGKTYGRNSPNGGSIEIDNSDGEYDHLSGWGFDGRSVRIFYGDIGSDWSSYLELLNGTLTKPFFEISTSTSSSISFTVRDKNQSLEKAIQPNLYLGTNSGTTGDEGLVDDIKGAVKPLCFGACFNVTPRQCNSAGLRYQVHDGRINDVPACYDRGVSLTKTGGTPSAGQYSVNTTTGIITLGGTPAGTVTCDVEGHSPSGVYKNSVADICESILLNYSGIVSGEINSTAISGLNSSNNSVVGIYVDSKENIDSIISELCSSIGAYWFFDRLGIYQTGRLEAPVSGGEKYTDIEVIGLDSFRSSDEDKGIPVNKFIVEYKKIFTVQSGDMLAGSVTVARTGFLGSEYRSSSDKDAAVLTAHILSPEIKRKTYLTVEANAISEATRLLGLYKVIRSFYRIVIPKSETVELGDSINICLDRFGLQSGKDFIIMSISDQTPEDNTTEMEVWG